MHKKRTLIIISALIFSLCILSSCGEKDDDTTVEDLEAYELESEMPVEGSTHFTLADYFSIPLPKGYEAGETYYKDIEEDEPASISFQGSEDPEALIDIYIDSDESFSVDEYESLKSPSTEDKKIYKYNQVKTPLGDLYYRYSPAETTVVAMESDIEAVPEIYGILNYDDYFMTITMNHIHYDEDTMEGTYRKISEKDLSFFENYVKTISKASSEVKVKEGE